MLRLAVLAALTLVDTSPPGPPLSAEDFEAHTTGQTLTYATQGGVYGVEEYLPGRRVRWAFNGDDCADGIWYPVGEAICFEYDGMAVPQCWTFHLRGDGNLQAVFVNDPDSPDYFETARSPEPLECRGPAIGV